MNDHPPAAGQGAQARLSEQREREIRAHLEVGSTYWPESEIVGVNDLLAELDATRAERDAAMLLAHERLEEIVDLNEKRMAIGDEASHYRTAARQLRSDLEALRAALDWSEALAAWATNVLGIVVERRVPSADVVSDGEGILAGLHDALHALQPAAPVAPQEAGEVFPASCCRNWAWAPEMGPYVGVHHPRCEQRYTPPDHQATTKGDGADDHE